MAQAAAVVELIGSIASLIDLGVKVVAQLGDFTAQTLEVPELFRSLEKRLPLLASTLQAIQQQADAARFPAEVSTALRILTDSTSSQLKVIETCLSKITPPIDGPRLHQVGKALQSLAENGDIRAAVNRAHQDIDFLVLHQNTQHDNTNDQILAALAQLQLEQAPASSSSFSRSHLFGSVVANDHARLHLGDVNHVHQHIYKRPKPDTFKVFGLCLAPAPRIEPDSFFGRVRELEDMAKALRPGEAGIEQRRLILGGLGGMGKTQLAIAYARHHHASYTSTLWLNATSELTLKASFRSIAETLIDISSTKQLDDQQALTSVFRWLSDGRNTRWLLIYDNHDEPDQFKITTYMPSTCNGTIILTTRLPDSVLGQRVPQVRVGPLEDLDEGLQILQGRSQRADVQHDPDARRLANRLAGLPLALATAGAYMRKTNLTFRQYLEAYEQRFNVNPRTPVQLQEYTDKTLYTTWDLTYRQIEKHDPLAANILKLLAYFDNQQVWFELLNAGVRDDLPDWIQEVASEHIDFENVMGTLVDYCLIEVQPKTRSYSMHNCVHDWTLAQLNRVISEQLFWYTIGCIAASVDQEDWGGLQRQRHARLTRHALRCTKILFRQLANMDAIPIDRIVQLLSIAIMLHGQSQYTTAEQMYLRALADCKKTLEPNHILTFRTINNLGAIYDEQGKFYEAEQMYLRALAGYKKILKPDHPSTLKTVNNLGILYEHQGKLNEAEQMYLRALGAYEKELGPDHVSTLQTVHNLGILYLKQNRLNEAEQMYLRALTQKEKILRSDHTSILDSKHGLANLYRHQGKLNQAELMYQQILIGYETALGNDHPSTLTLVYNFGLLYEEQDRLREGKDMFQRALVGYQKCLGQEHPRTREAADGLDRLYRKQDSKMGGGNVNQ